MKLIVDQGELSLPSDFSFDVEKNSAFFSEDGSTTIPATIPATTAANNLSFILASSSSPHDYGHPFSTIVIPDVLDDSVHVVGEEEI